MTDLSEPFEGFIEHPSAIPLSFRVRRSTPWPWRKAAAPEPGAIGILFQNPEYIAPGTHLELAITPRNEVQSFVGEVVLVREISGGFQIGVWLNTRADSTRARLVERICHMESYLTTRRLRDGPYLSRETVTRDWAKNFSARFPS